jgi:hypothetical protein
MLIVERCNMAAQIFHTLLPALFLLQLNWQYGSNISRTTELSRQTCSDSHPLLNSLLAFQFLSLSFFSGFGPGFLYWLSHLCSFSSWIPSLLSTSFPFLGALFVFFSIVGTCIAFLTYAGLIMFNTRTRTSARNGIL